MHSNPFSVNKLNISIQKTTETRIPWKLEFKSLKEKSLQISWNQRYSIWLIVTLKYFLPIWITRSDQKHTSFYISLIQITQRHQLCMCIFVWGVWKRHMSIVKIFSARIQLNQKKKTKKKPEKSIIIKVVAVTAQN